MDITGEKNITTTKHRVNQGIKGVNQVRLVKEDGTQAGTVSFHDALNMAKAVELDLVEVAPNSTPPVCKIMDFGKFQFEEKKKEKEQKRAAKISAVETKEIQINSVIQDGDLEIKIKNIKRILEEGNKVRVLVKFVGRQVQHIGIGKIILEKIVQAIPDAVIEKQPFFEARNLMMTLSSNTK